MGLFFNTNKYDTKECYFSKEEIKRLVSSYKIKSLDSEEESLVEDLVITRRGNDGKISLYQIDEVLKKMMDQNKISKYDRSALMQSFERFFKSKEVK